MSECGYGLRIVWVWHDLHGCDNSSELGLGTRPEWVSKCHESVMGHNSIPPLMTSSQGPKAWCEGPIVWCVLKQVGWLEVESEIKVEWGANGYKGGSCCGKGKTFSCCFKIPPRLIPMYTVVRNACIPRNISGDSESDCEDAQRLQYPRRCTWRMIA